MFSISEARTYLYLKPIHCVQSVPGLAKLFFLCYSSGVAVTKTSDEKRQTLSLLQFSAKLAANSTLVRRKKVCRSAQSTSYTSDKSNDQIQKIFS